MQDEQAARLTALAREAKTRPGQIVTGYDASDREHLARLAAQHRAEANRLEVQAGVEVAE